MEKRKIWLFTAFIVVLLIGLCSPVIGWLLKPAATLEILIIDKTVPDDSYREHLGLTWFLNQQKVRKTDGSDYQLQTDYVGYVPGEGGEHEVRAYPEGKVHDVIYVADGYGVYEEDLTTGNAQGERSGLIYGGMTMEDVDYIREAVFNNGAALIGEFNTFGSPTPQDVKESFYQMYNLEWTGWIGRFFPELEGSEVPVWAKNNYQEQYSKEWIFTGKGMVFVDDNDRLLVLTESDMKEQHVMFEYTENGTEHFGLEDKAPYHYWFDIIVPKDQDEVLATFSLSLTDDAEAVLKEKGIPTKFPAIIHHQNPVYESYYFSGDFADQANLPSFYQAEGFPALKKWQARKKDDLESFYWRIYHPMMKEIIHQQKKKSGAQQESSAAFTGSSFLTGKAGSEYLQIQRDGKWEDFLIKGVNMGIAKPGTWPGETAITKQEYFRWFQQIGAMHANAIRIYTIHPPHFYETLAEYNRLAEEPIYLFHGVWLNEEIFLETHDAFSEENVKDFKEEIQRTIDLIHGNAVLEERPGHAGGTYTADVSPYVLGWVLGVEWDPHVVLNTNEMYTGMAEFDGEYIYTQGAEPFEIWLAEMMEYTIAYEQETYQWQRPMSFTNWVTTDLLEHPSEPSEEEDLVSVNPNFIFAKDTFEAGMFASYHIYPYYPDFLNFEKRYVDYVDHRGEKNNYAGYLQHMKEMHRMPLLVAEFGIPSSRGNTHNNVYGWNQGGHTEKEQGEIVAHLFEDIVEEKMAGGLIFSWHDEWFKRTWNTMDFDNPDQRPFWKNVQTNEQMFGMLTFEPGQKQKIVIDGKEEDWNALGQDSVYKPSSVLKEMQVTHDEGFLYVKLKAEEMQKHTVSLLFNVLDNQGQSQVVPGSAFTTKGIDFILQVDNGKQARLLVDSYYDSFYYMYGHKLEMVEKKEYADKKDNGVFHPIRLTLNKELTYKGENGKEQFVPFDSYETGILRFGNSNPNDEAFDSLTDFHLNEEEGTFEIRIPWALLNVKDPGHKEVMGDMWTGEGLTSSARIEGVRIGAIAVSDGEVVDSFPKAVNGMSRKEDYYLYDWDLWEMPTYHERLKQSYYIMQELFSWMDVRER